MPGASGLGPGLVPERYQLAFRYWYKRLRGQLDPELGALDHLVPHRLRAIDVGANYGLYTYAFSRTYRSVEAFEPLADCARVIEARQAANVSVHRVALSAAAGTGTLYLPHIRDKWDAGRASLLKPHHQSRAIPTTVRTLDEYAFRDVSVIKIDVEGSELDVLQGARGTLDRERPVLLVEIEQRHLAMPIREAFRGVEAMGYRGLFLEDGETKTLDRFAYEVQQQPYLADTDDPRYINNFLFTPIG